jgi:hypothetical protein
MLSLIGRCGMLIRFRYILVVTHLKKDMSGYVEQMSSAGH